jgi:WD40 repeat protein
MSLTRCAVLAAAVGCGLWAADGRGNDKNPVPPARPEAKDPPLPAGALGRVPASQSQAMFSPDGKHFLAGSADEPHTYCLWDAATYMLVRSFTGPKKPGELFGTFVGFNAASFSGDGKLLATTSEELRLWEVETGKELRSWRGHTDGARAVELTADGKVLVSTPSGHKGRDLFVRVWDVQTGKQRHEFPCGKNHLATALSPSGKQVAVLDGDAHTITIWDVESGKQVRQFPTERYGNQFRLHYLPGGKSLLVVNMADRGGIRRYDAEAGKDLGLAVAQAEVRGVAIPKDFSFAVTMTGNDRVVRLWDLATGKVKGTIPAADNALWAVAVSPDGKVLATQIQEPKAPFVFWKAPG